jgi:hypothetical protein
MTGDMERRKLRDMRRQARRDDRRGLVVRGRKILCQVAVRSWDAQGVGGTVSGDDDVIGEPDVETEGDDGVGCVGQVICICPYVPLNARYLTTLNGVL